LSFDLKKLANKTTAYIDKDERSFDEDYDYEELNEHTARGNALLEDMFLKN